MAGAQTIGPKAAAADSLRQHDLVQVQRVLLSPVARTPLSRTGTSGEIGTESRPPAACAGQKSGTLFLRLLPGQMAKRTPGEPGARSGLGPEKHLNPEGNRWGQCRRSIPAPGRTVISAKECKALSFDHGAAPVVAVLGPHQQVVSNRCCTRPLRTRFAFFGPFS